MRDSSPRADSKESAHASFRTVWGVFAPKRSPTKKTQIGELGVPPIAGDRTQTGFPQREAALIIGASGLRRLPVIEGAGRRLLRRQTNGPRERPLGAGVEFGPARRHNCAQRRDA